MSAHQKTVANELHVCDNVRGDEMREFLIIVRQALKMVVAWIERKYNLGDLKTK